MGTKKKKADGTENQTTLKSKKSPTIDSGVLIKKKIKDKQKTLAIVKQQIETSKVSAERKKLLLEKVAKDKANIEKFKRQIDKWIKSEQFIDKEEYMKKWREIVDKLKPEFVGEVLKPLAIAQAVQNVNDSLMVELNLDVSLDAKEINNLLNKALKIRLFTKILRFMGIPKELRNSILQRVVQKDFPQTLLDTLKDRPNEETSFRQITNANK